MADNDRWRNEQEHHSYRDDDRERWRDEDYRRGGGGGAYRGGYGRGRGSDAGPNAQRGSDAGSAGYDRNQARGGYRGDQDAESMSDLYGRGAYGSVYRGRDRADPRSRPNRDFGGNDYNRGFYGADQGRSGRVHGPHQDSWGYRGERSGWDRFSDEVSSWFGDDEAARRREQDARQGDQGAQHHRGRGPKGYIRSDERIREDVSDRLTDDPFVDASEIEVGVSSCEVTLSGTVDSREAKHRAEDCAERVSGVRHVQNNLRVQPSGMGQGTAEGAA
ncbi:BON domain-containing protein [Microvirga sp. M2]|uniref:BON domain-containing protein n=1 Tax=Microvirga sp. M2 TaxID=3073270 RepID=UPI0039C36D0B